MNRSGFVGAIQLIPYFWPGSNAGLFFISSRKLKKRLVGNNVPTKQSPLFFIESGTIFVATDIFVFATGKISMQSVLFLLTV